MDPKLFDDNSNAYEMQNNSNNLLEIDSKEITEASPVIQIYQDPHELPITCWNSFKSKWLLYSGTGYEDDESTGQKTLIIYSIGARSLIMFACIWWIITISIIAYVIYASIYNPDALIKFTLSRSSEDIWTAYLGPVFFIFAGIFLTRAAMLSCYSKVWIDVTPTTLKIERGFRRRGKTKTIQRSITTKVCLEKGLSFTRTPDEEEQELFNLYLADENGQEVTVASNLPHHLADEYVEMFKLLLSVNI